MFQSVEKLHFEVILKRERLVKIKVALKYGHWLLTGAEEISIRLNVMISIDIGERVARGTAVPLQVERKIAL